jgi:DNA polymerase
MICLDGRAKKKNLSAMDDRYAQLDALKAEVSACRKCKLCTTRTQTVFGEGSYDAKVLFIGEGPGREEDLQGRPFVGRAGQLLSAIIEKGMKLPRESVFIANVVKCRPTIDLAMQKDRAPDEEEVLACGGYLRRQIELINPKVIITLGNPSTKFLLNPSQGITKIRGQWGLYNGIRVMPTYHPSYVLRNGGDTSPLKKDVWEDIKKVLAYLASDDKPEAVTPVTAAPKSGSELYESVNRAMDAEHTSPQGNLF